MADPTDDLSGATVAAASPAAFAHMTSGGRWVPYEYLLLIDEYLLRVAAGEIDRLIVEAPVRHGKSLLISRYLPAWWLGRKPDDQIILASYEATFASTWGRKARDTLSEWGPRVFGVTVAEYPAAAKEWCVQGHKGIMVTAGIGSGVTGKGADLILVDDPVKDATEANSEVYRQRAWDWWQGTIGTRLEPNGAVVLIMARWHEDDLAGRVQANQDPKRPWTVLRLPALAEADDPLGRKVGDALCPERFDETALQRNKQERGAYFFNALYQQRPAPAEGLLFKRANFRYWESHGEDENLIYRLKDGDSTRTISANVCSKFQTCDPAASEKEMADFTVVSTWLATPQKDLILLDVKRQKFETLQLEAFLSGVSDEHGRPPMWIETLGAGRVPHKQLIAKGYPVRELKPEYGSKTAKVQRAMVAVAYYEQHKVFHPDHFREGEFEHELVSFPTAAYDDMVDSLSYAAQLLPTMSVVQEIRKPSAGTIMGKLAGRRW